MILKVSHGNKNYNSKKDNLGDNIANVFLVDKKTIKQTIDITSPSVYDRTKNYQEKYFLKPNKKKEIEIINHSVHNMTQSFQLLIKEIYGNTNAHTMWGLCGVAQSYFYHLLKNQSNYKCYYMTNHYDWGDIPQLDESRMPHGISILNQDKKWYIVDPTFQQFNSKTIMKDYKINDNENLLYILLQQPKGKEIVHALTTQGYILVDDAIFSSYFYAMGFKPLEQGKYQGYFQNLNTTEGYDFHLQRLEEIKIIL